MKKIIKKHWYIISILIIIIFAIFLRFYNYENRWALAGDQARDAIIARESLHTLTPAVLGPFSSAGNFTTGPVWYWWLTLTTMIFPYSVLTPWIMLTATYIAFVYVMILIGKELGGKPLALILGILAAVSPAQIDQSRNLTNPSLVALFSVLALYFAIKYVKTGKNIFIFLFPFFISQSIQTHFQALNLLILIPIALIIKRPSIKSALLFIIGLIIPSIQYLLYDFTNQFYNIRGIVDYAQYGQYKVYIANRWLTYAGIFWPQTWATVIGVLPFTGYLSLVLVTIVTIYSVTKKKITKPIVLVLTSFLLMFIALRYYRGERFGGYYIFLHPFILTLTAWACFQLMKAKQILGFLLLAVLVAGSTIVNMKQILPADNYTARQAEGWSNLLIKTYPYEQFAIYEAGNGTPSKSLPLVLFLDSKNKINDNGHKISFGSPPETAIKAHFTIVKNNPLDYELWDITSSSSAQLEKLGWKLINPSATAKWHLGNK